MGLSWYVDEGDKEEAWLEPKVGYAKPVNNVSKAWKSRNWEIQFKTAQNKALYSASHFNEGAQHICHLSMEQCKLERELWSAVTWVKLSKNVYFHVGTRHEKGGYSLLISGFWLPGNSCLMCRMPSYWDSSLERLLSWLYSLGTNLD